MNEGHFRVLLNKQMENLLSSIYGKPKNGAYSHRDRTLVTSSNLHAVVVFDLTHWDQASRVNAS